MFGCELSFVISYSYTLVLCVTSLSVKYCVAAISYCSYYLSKEASKYLGNDR